MGLFTKKNCDICGEKIGLLGNKKLADGNMCKDCEKLLSRHFDDRRKTTIEEIKQHLAYREENKKAVANFHVSRILGSYTKVLIDEDAGKFIVTSLENWVASNPDVIDLSQIKDCQIKIRDYRNELKRKDGSGNEVSFSPPRYEYEYDFGISIDVDSPWFDDIYFTINDHRVYMYGSKEYRELERQANEIKDTLLEVDRAVKRDETQYTKN